MVSKHCLVCNKAFSTKPSRDRRGWGRFCCSKCWGIWLSENTKGTHVGENNPAWHGGKVRCVCIGCQLEFFLFPSAIRRGRGRFCSRKCAIPFRSKEQSYQWKGGDVEITCLICGKKKHVPKREIRHGHGRCCSRTCAAIFRMKKTLKSSTSIERKIEAVLKKLGVEYESQKVVPEGRTIADFYIPAQRIVVYCDGSYWHSLPGYKKRDLTQDLSLGLYGYSVLRLSESEINSNLKKCEKKIANLVGRART